jgi:hypothetical protein
VQYSPSSVQDVPIEVAAFWSQTWLPLQVAAVHSFKSVSVQVAPLTQLSVQTLGEPTLPVQDQPVSTVQLVEQPELLPLSQSS